MTMKRVAVHSMWVFAVTGCMTPQLGPMANRPVEGEGKTMTPALMSQSHPKLHPDLLENPPEDTVRDRVLKGLARSYQYLRSNPQYGDLADAVRNTFHSAGGLSTENLAEINKWVADFIAEAEKDPASANPAGVLQMIKGRYPQLIR
jgi:hypothetical protein